jgi:tripartite-type tricarboxylate transporter receptor subunit TctC
MRKIAALAFVLACIGAAPPAALAQTYPAKSIRLIVPFSPGGSADIVGRVMSQELGALYSQPVVVENRPGAGGNLGAEAVAKSPADGYTLLLGTIGIHAAYKIYPKLPYDPARDLQPINMLAELPNVLIVNPGVRAASLKEFMAMAKEQPGQIFFGSAGNGSSTHMAGELFKHISKLDLRHVPYKGSAPALTDVVSGQIQAMFENLPGALPMIRSGKVRALGVTSRSRNPSLPDVPSIAEAGLPDYAFTAWFTVAAPRGVPAPIVAKLNADINTVMHQPRLAAKWSDLGVLPMSGDAASAEAYIAAEAKIWTAVIEAARLRAE